ncbi:MAG: YbhB/YbcL family Raf kinase inhibitor-like protein [Pedobacter sp.]|nr:YbhB/YbcL family Raf kinase inhibitor-like protein [Pedobacter sp.]
MKLSSKTGIFITAIMLLAGIAKSQNKTDFRLVSTAFAEGKPIPSRFTCDSINVSPPLSWSGFPEKTKSFAIIMDDPDAPSETWVHWVMYNIPNTITNLDENKSASAIKATEGLNSWAEKGYNGPCPPGGTHRYIFKLYALDQAVAETKALDKEGLLHAMKGHILAETALTGLFRVN